MAMPRRRGPSANEQIQSEIPIEQGYSREDRNRFVKTLGEGQGELETSIKAAMSSAMPGFRNEMQDVQETEQRRGIGLGGLGTSYEGDLESAFQRNIANAAGSQAMNLYSAHLGASERASEQSGNRYLDLLAGQRDADIAAQNAKSKRKHGLFGFLGSALGAGAGALIGGPAGAKLGADVGGGLGGAFG